MPSPDTFRVLRALRIRIPADADRDDPRTEAAAAFNAALDDAVRAARECHRTVRIRRQCIAAIGGEFSIEEIRRWLEGFQCTYADGSPALSLTLESVLSMLEDDHDGIAAWRERRIIGGN